MTDFYEDILKTIDDLELELMTDCENDDGTYDQLEMYIKLREIVDMTRRGEPNG